MRNRLTELVSARVVNKMSVSKTNTPGRLIPLLIIVLFLGSVMPLGGVNVDVVLPALNRLAPVIQSLVAKKVHLRRTPRLRFLLDDSFENAARMNQLIHAMKQGS